MEVPVTVRSLLEQRNEDDYAPFDLIDEGTNHIWFYDWKLRDYWNEDDDTLLFRDYKDLDRIVKIQGFYEPDARETNKDLELYARIDILYKELQKINEKLDKLQEKC